MKFKAIRIHFRFLRELLLRLKCLETGNNIRDPDKHLMRYHNLLNNNTTAMIDKKIRTIHKLELSITLFQQNTVKTKLNNLYPLV